MKEGSPILDTIKKSSKNILVGSLMFITLSNSLPTTAFADFEDMLIKPTFLKELPKADM